jgi:hypothetical protein
MMWRATVSLLHRSGAQSLLGESWLHAPDECGEAAEYLVTAALAQYGNQIEEASGELVIRIASRQFECIDPPADRIAPSAGPKPSIATSNSTPVRYKAGRF